MTKKRIIFLGISLIMIFGLLGCAGGKRPRAHDSRRYIKEHELDRLPKFDIPVEMNDRVVAWMEYFQGPGRGHFRRYLERSGRYMPLMQEILKKKGLPKDLIYIALIESGFNTQARSYASAVGPWQFIQSTGRRYGLKIDGWVDERRDPYKSTAAAAEYFKDLYDEFGNWYLAMAGYNGGEGRVRQAIAATGSKNFWELADDRRAFRAETRDYVPKYIAAAVMAKMPEKFGFDKIEYKEPFDFEKGIIETQTDLEVVAKCAGVSEDDIVDLNPHLVRGATPPEERNYEIRLPGGTAKSFKEKYAALPKEERIQIVRYEVRRGDTLVKVARRFGVSTTALASANGISARRRSLKRGITLVIPSGASAKYAMRIRDDDINGDNDGARKPVRHVVKKGETLGSIARRYKMTTKELMALNYLKSPKNIHVGTRLLIKGPRTRIRADEDSTALANVGPGRESTKFTPGKQHKVVRGDTLATVASRYGVTVKQLMALNNLSNPRHIRPGMVLVIREAKPKDKQTTAIKLDDSEPKAVQDASSDISVNETAASAKEAARIEATVSPLKEQDVNGGMTPIQSPAGQSKLPSDSPLQSMEAPFDPQTRIENMGGRASGASKVVYQVKSGDTLWDIARRHKVSIAQLQKWNNLGDKSTVKPGTALTINKE